MSQAKEAQDMKPSLSPGGIASMLVVLAVFIALAWLLINRADALQPGDTAAEEPAHGEVAEAEEVIPAEGEAEEQAIVRTYDAPPPMTINPEHEYTATITTPRGDIRIRLFPEVAPQTVNNFVFLARNDFYNGLTWHRVIADFMAQGGDPAGTGAGGPGYSIPAEFSDELRFDQPGKVAMARSADPDSAGSQFFITTAPAPWLNGQYTIFGEVLEGQEIVNDIPLRDPAMAAEPGEEIMEITITETEG